MPSVADYKRAFRAIQAKINPKQFEMLEAHYHAPNRSITMTEMADAIGYNSYSPTNLHYGKLGRMMAEELGYKKERLRGQSKYIDALAIEEPNWDRSQEWQWIMRPEVAKALNELGWV